MQNNKLHFFVYSVQYNFKKASNMILNQVCTYNLVLMPTQTLIFGVYDWMSLMALLLP